MTADAVKRLEAIVSLEDLGAGFILASHDLEIRGAGELLGDVQSGNMHAIGFTLFMELLDKAVHDLKHGKEPDLTMSVINNVEIDLRIGAIIPDTYIVDVHTRLTFYKRISNSNTHDQLRNVQIEMIDRFGLLPQAVKWLIQMIEIKLLAEPLGIIKISGTAQGVTIELNQQPAINHAHFFQLLQQQPQRYKIKGTSALQMIYQSNTNDARLLELKQLIMQDLTPRRTK